MKRKIALLSAIIMIFMTGCAEKNEIKEPPIQELAKGRYLETDLGPFEETEYILDMRMLSDGRLAVFDAANGLLLSEDGGKSFQKKETEFLKKADGQDFLPSEAAIGTDGSVFVKYDFHAAGDGMSKAGYFYTDADGKEEEIRISDTAQKFSHFLILKDGRLLAGAEDGVYEVDKKDGSIRIFCRTAGEISCMQEAGDFLYLVYEDDLKIFDLKKEEFTEDSVLADFLAAENTERTDVDFYPILLGQGDTDNALYVATPRGLFRHVAGGSVMEELMKGNLSSLGAPELKRKALVCLSTDSFLICYNDADLKSYIYQADSDTVPPQAVTVYSLKTNEAVRIAVNLYRKKHPDVNINYEVGLSGEGAATKEDAIRNLNTRLLAGEGPDVLVLDGLPLHSYAEKGILKDISPMLEEERENGVFFENIVTAFEEDGKICAVPAFFSFPVIIGEEGKKVTDLKSLADCVEKLRQENPEGNIIASDREKEVLLRLYTISIPAIIKEDGSIDKEKLTEYLTQAKRIWDAEKSSMHPFYVELNESEEEWANTHYERADYYYEWHRLYYDRFRVNTCRLIFGFYQRARSDYAEDVSLLKELGQDDQIYLQNGLAGNVFETHTVLGVNATGSNIKEAEALVQSMLEEDIQAQNKSMGFQDDFLDSPGLGFPVNRNGLKDILNFIEPGQTIYMMGTETPDGEDVQYDVFSPEPEEQEMLYRMIEQLDTPVFTDLAVRDVIVDQGIPVLRGEISIEDAANEIINRIQIYLEE